LHSGGASSTQWRRIAPLLSDKYRLIAPDLFGFGDTGQWKGSTPLTHDLQADLVEAVIAATLSAPVDLVGHSYGGATAVRLAVRRPQLLRRLVLIEPILPTLLREDEPELFEEYRRVAEGFMEYVEADHAPDAWALFLDYRNGRGTWENMAETARARFLAQTVQTVEGFRSNLNNPTTLAECQGLRLPTMIVCGAETRKPDETVTRILDEAIPNSRYVSIPEAAHMSPLTHPDAVAEAVHAHLSQVGI
jgi:pimeloyl-ACP methyl ester carboxylesterase